MSPKCRTFLLLVFACICISKSLLIKILKCDDTLHLFRSLKKCSKKQINCDCSIEFLRLCQNFNVTPTFARVDKDKTSKWKKSSESYSKNVLAEELRAKIKQSEALASEINSIYSSVISDKPVVCFGTLAFFASLAVFERTTTMKSCLCILVRSRGC